MSLFLRLRHSRILAAFLFIFVFLLVIQTGIALFLKSRQNQISKNLSSRLNLNISLDDISFSFIKGVSLKEAAIGLAAHQTASVILKDNFLSLDLRGLFAKKLIISMETSELCLSMEKDNTQNYVLQIVCAQLCAAGQNNSWLSRNLSGIKINSRRINFTPNLFLKNAVCVIDRLGRINFTSQAALRYYLPVNSPLAKLIQLPIVSQEFNFNIQATLIGKDLALDLIAVNIAQNEILGTGLIKGFTTLTPCLDISFFPSMVELRGIDIVRKYFSGKGYFIVSAKLQGLLGSLKTIISANLDNCKFNLPISWGQRIEFDKLCGKITFQDNNIDCENLSFLLNDIAFNLSSRIAQINKPQIYCKLFCEEPNIEMPIKNLILIFSGSLNHQLTGDLQFNNEYKFAESAYHLSLQLKNITFDYLSQAQKKLAINSVEIESTDKAGDTKKLKFSDLKAGVSLKDKYIEIPNMAFQGYKSTIEAKAKFNPKVPRDINFSLEANNLDVAAIMRDLDFAHKLSGGKMNIKINLDPSIKYPLQATCLIKNGTINLDVLSSSINLPSMEDTQFNYLSAEFLADKGLLKIQRLKLEGEDIEIEAHADIGSSVEGKIKLDLSRQLLYLSTPFRRLIKLTQTKDAFLEFEFLIGGTPEALRFLWLKGKFKDKIESTLPGWIKSSIERQIDGLVNDLAK